MVIVMVVVMIGFFWHGGMGHGGDRAGHMSTASEAAKSPLDLLDETYARGEIGREEWQRKRADLLKR
jgi:uncharacterized membrane protein